MRPTLQEHLEKFEVEKRAGLHQEPAVLAISEALYRPADAENAR
jgi:hypothetical protein